MSEKGSTDSKKNEKKFCSPVATSGAASRYCKDTTPPTLSSVKLAVEPASAHPGTKLLASASAPTSKVPSCALAGGQPPVEVKSHRKPLSSGLNIHRLGS